jgi:hypothetical protein
MDQATGQMRQAVTAGVSTTTAIGAITPHADAAGDYENILVRRKRVARGIGTTG